MAWSLKSEVWSLMAWLSPHPFAVLHTWTTTLVQYLAQGRIHICLREDCLLVQACLPIMHSARTEIQQDWKLVQHPSIKKRKLRGCDLLNIRHSLFAFNSESPNRLPLSLCVPRSKLQIRKRRRWWQLGNAGSTKAPDGSLKNQIFKSTTWEDVICCLWLWFVGFPLLRVRKCWNMSDLE